MSTTIYAQRNPLTLISCSIKQNPPFQTWVPREFSSDSRVSVSRMSDERFYTLRLSYASPFACVTAHNDARCWFLNADAVESELRLNARRISSCSFRSKCSMQHAGALEISSGRNSSNRGLFFGPTSHRGLNPSNQHASCPRLSDGHSRSSTHRVFRSPNRDRRGRSLGRHHCSAQVDLAPSRAAAVRPLRLHALFRGRCRVFLAPAVFS